MVECSERDGALVFNVRVVPRAARSTLAGAHDGALRVRLAAPPVDGAANAELVRLLARSFDIPARDVEIMSGHASRLKRVSVRGATREQLKSILIQE